MEKHVRTFLHDCEKKFFPVGCWDAKIGNAQKIPSKKTIKRYEIYRADHYFM